MVSKYNTFDNDCKLLEGTLLSIHETDLCRRKKFIATVSRNEKDERNRKHRVGSFPVEREPRVLSERWRRKVELRNVRRDNRGRLFRKFDGMRSPRERERHHRNKEKPSIAADEEGRKSESLHKHSLRIPEENCIMPALQFHRVSEICAHTC